MRGVLVWLVLGACGGDGHPDTGYGGGAPVPARVTCFDACSRIADCAVALCNEDTHTTDYSDAMDLLRDDCVAGCDDNLLAAQLSQTAWSCMFTETCRGVFEHDACEIEARYTCQR